MGGFRVCVFMYTCLCTCPVAITLKMLKGNNAIWQSPLCCLAFRSFSRNILVLCGGEGVNGSESTSVEKVSTMDPYKPYKSLLVVSTSFAGRKTTLLRILSENLVVKPNSSWISVINQCISSLCSCCIIFTP